MNNTPDTARQQSSSGKAVRPILGMEQNCSVCGAPARPLHVYQGRQLCGKHCPECNVREESSSGGRELAKTATQFQPEELTNEPERNHYRAAPKARVHYRHRDERA